jgi:leader peptidase (prepilin peptidase) / N-methyltransferase
MLDIIALLCLAGALVLLYALSVIDLREGLLPNELVMGLAALGMIFHLCTTFSFMSAGQMLLGALAGGGLLYSIRAAANFYYAQDALGLGDVKLLGAAGLWLGPYYVMTALVLGACAGILHGLAVALWLWRKTGRMPALSTLSLPAGPGFAIGIVLTGLIAFRNLPALMAP